MEEKFNHTILVVDDEAKAIEKIVGTLGVDTIFAASAAEGIEKIKSASIPFSLIISNQRMPGMKGYEFLEKAREITPDSVRVLVTGYSDMDPIIDAVNRGAIHRYISKSWDNEEFISTVRSGLSLYEVSRGNERLLRLAKDQNAKLYMLNCDLKEKTESDQKVIEQLDREIEALTGKTEGGKVAAGGREEECRQQLETILKENGLLTLEKLEAFQKAFLGELLERFQDLAARNGFSMPGGAG
ncbi:MAG: response regulator [Desulfobacteraceae bacterium]|nr:response regulator [Desulfobacteraceae bacterium]